MLLIILGVTIAAGLISGIYPALVLSGFRPAMVLRANSSGQAGSGSPAHRFGGDAIRRFHRRWASRSVWCSPRSTMRATSIWASTRTTCSSSSGSRLLTIAGQESFIAAAARQSRYSGRRYDQRAALRQASYWQTSAQLAGHPEHVELSERVFRSNIRAAVGDEAAGGAVVFR